MAQRDAAIGVLDLQGGVQEHLEHLAQLGVRGRRVKKAEDFAGLCGLILPGGESTCLSRLLRIFGLDDVIRVRHGQGLKLWGTCAGAILLATRVVGEEPHLGLIDLEIERNAFGSQLDSFTAEAVLPKVDAAPIPLTFIRAPKIRSVGTAVEPLLNVGDFIAAAESAGVLVTVFHPELTPSVAFHRYFAHKCGVPVNGMAAAGDEVWTRQSWMRFAPIPMR